MILDFGIFEIFEKLVKTFHSLEFETSSMSSDTTKTNPKCCVDNIGHGLFAHCQS